MTTPEAARIRAVLDELHVGVFPPAPYLNGTEIAERIAAALTPLAPEAPRGRAVNASTSYDATDGAAPEVSPRRDDSKPARRGRTMRKRVAFRLSMPGRSSWNGGWSGADRNYVIVRSLGPADFAVVMGEADKRSFHHRWDDGWAASIEARVMSPGERAPKSDGFCGYDWMVGNIIDHGDPYAAIHQQDTDRAGGRG